MTDPLEITIGSAWTDGVIANITKAHRLMMILDMEWACGLNDKAGIKNGTAKTEQPLKIKRVRRDLKSSS